jgi:hypothetical protein
VVSSITSDVNKLPHYVILNSKIIPKSEMFPKYIIVLTQRNGWMTADLMESRVKESGRDALERFVTRLVS